jgi:hypothetical protein
MTMTLILTTFFCCTAQCVIIAGFAYDSLVEITISSRMQVAVRR